MVDDIDLKKWIQKRIDYWESICANHKVKKCPCDFDEGMEKGILDGLYQVMEFIEDPE